MKIYPKNGIRFSMLSVFVSLLFCIACIGTVEKTNSSSKTDQLSDGTAEKLVTLIESGLNANIEIERSEGTRTFDLYIPEGLVENPALVIDLHPLSTTKENQRNGRKMDELAEEVGEFIVAWPQGIGNSWNAGQCCVEASYREIDDVGFIREMVDTIAEQVDIDWDRIYATGYSNGSSMSHRLAYMAPDLIAAIATNHFHMTAEQFEEASEQQFRVPVPVLSIHGYNDMVVCWQDICPNSIGEFLEPLGLMSAYQHGKRGWHRWAELNECNGEITTIAKKGILQLNHDNFKWKKAYLECSAGVEVHQILNSRNHMGEFLGGSGSGGQGDYNVEVWEFLSRWSKEETLANLEAEIESPAELDEPDNFYEAVVEEVQEEISETIEEVTTIDDWFDDTTVEDIAPEGGIVDTIIEAIVDFGNEVIIKVFSWF